MYYFASKSSPTDVLLLYFEVISDLKANELNVIKNNISEKNCNKSEKTEPIKQTALSSLPNDKIDIVTFLSNFIEIFSVKDNLFKLKCGDLN